MFVPVPIVSKPAGILPQLSPPDQSTAVGRGMPREGPDTVASSTSSTGAAGFAKANLDHETYRNARTRGQFKPRNANKGTSSYQLRQFAEATLGSGSLRKAVKLPEGEDLSEWLAVNGLFAFLAGLGKHDQHY